MTAFRISWSALRIPLLILFFNYLSIFGCAGVFVAVHGLSLVAVSGGYSLVVVHGLLIVVASLVVGHRL